jgi:drug/metabolite transporter (DMT)-like permease
MPATPDEATPDGVTADDGARPTTPTVWAALVTVYIVWGTTYFAIRIVNQTLPPLLAASVRFLVAGGLMFAFTIGRGDAEADRPGRRQWAAAAIIGGALLLGGNGAVVWAERTVPSGIVALIIALIPLWMALIDAVLGRRPRPRVAFGLLIGFAGAAMLVGTAASGSIPLVGMLFAVGASISWASGSLYARSAPLPRRPFVGIGMEMLCGGVGLFAAGVLAGDLGRIDLERASLASVLALAYLIVFGSFAAFASYVWLLRNARTSLVSTYAYVNPVVAVFLGWAFLDESITLRTVAAGAIVLAAVAIIISASQERPTPEAVSGGELAQEPGDLGEADLSLEGAGDAQDHRLGEGGRGDLQADG